MHLQYGDTRLVNQDRLENYVIKQVIGKGSHSIVHLATCIRGRLRGRDVALKFFPRPPSPPTLEGTHVATTALHKSLYHPSVVTLHSAFTTTDSYCHALEFCAGGTLYDFLNSLTENIDDKNSKLSRLSEAQLRPILRSIIEGLSHLHARGIVHQNLNARSIFLTAEGRAKLGRLGHAFPIALTGYSNNENAENTENVSLETMTAEHQRIVQRELRSLGHLICALLTGVSCSHTEPRSKTAIFSQSTNIFPIGIKCSKEAETLVATLLAPDIQVQTALNSILSLPFFHSTQQTQFLKPDSTIVQMSKGPKNQRNDMVQCTRGKIQVYLDLQPRTTKQHDNEVETKGTLDSPGAVMPQTSPLDLAAGGSTSTMVSGIRDAWEQLTSRQEKIMKHNVGNASKPPEMVSRNDIPTCPPGNAKRSALADILNYGRPSTPEKALADMNCGPGLLSPPETQYRETPPPRELDISRVPLPVPPLRALSPRCSLSGMPNYHSPISRSNFPMELKVPPLFPQTHKLAHGQLVVLPSRSLLIDLREGERRAGRRGDHVLCVSADGRQIRVYEAPHLSTPCILSEPLSTWTLSALPSQYWDTYNFARNSIESIKKRTPKMTWYTKEAKFTLMSNSPCGDIHAIFPCPPPRKRQRRGVTEESHTFTRMRIVLSRTRGTLEVSRNVGSEWVTKVGRYPVDSSQMDLTEEEKVALKIALTGLTVCEAAETQSMDTATDLQQLTIEDLAVKDVKAAEGHVMPTPPQTVAQRPRPLLSSVRRRQSSESSSNP